MSKKPTVLDAIHSLAGSLRNESYNVANTADAFYGSGNEVMASRMERLSQRLHEMSKAADFVSNAYVSEVIGQAAESQRALDNFVLTLVNQKIKESP